MNDYNPRLLFWVPQFKWQAVKWLKARFPETNWAKRTKRACIKAYIEIRRRG